MSRRPLLRAWLFAALLVLLQQTALAHRIGHLGDAGGRTDEPASAAHVCVECLAFAGIDGAAAPAIAAAAATDAAPAAHPDAVPPAPTFGAAAVYRSRAPPARHAAAPRPLPTARCPTAPH